MRKRSRANFRIYSDLLKWAKSYAKRKNTSLTQLVIDFLTRLKSEDEKHA